MESASGNYSNRPWMRNVPVQVKRPNASFEDSMTGEALSASMGESAESIRQRRPPMPITLFPPKYGYRQDAIGISDIATLDSLYERRDFSQRSSGYGSTSYPSMNQF